MTEALPEKRRVTAGRDIIIRPAIASDTPFIMKEWLRTYAASEFAKRIDRDTFFRFHHLYAEGLLKRGAVVAAFPDDRDTLCGFLVGAGEVLNYIFVKGQFRRWGIAEAMLDDVFGKKQILYTHNTPDGRALLAKRPCRFNPYI